MTGPAAGQPGRLVLGGLATETQRTQGSIQAHPQGRFAYNPNYA